MIERHEEEIKQYLREKGFYPRKDKSLKLYIYQLRSRLKRNGKELVIKEVNDKVEVYIRPYREERCMRMELILFQFNKYYIISRKLPHQDI